jgi:hypothetical protein
MADKDKLQAFVRRPPLSLVIAATIYLYSLSSF